jgi:acetyltransferase-like isoleucine patch superfamily enzyme
MIRILKYFYKKYRIVKDPISYFRSLGVKIGDDCRLVGDVGFGSEPYLVKLGNHVSITTSNFITHDGGVWVFRDKYPLIDVISPIVVGNNVFIGANCTIMPGVVIGDNVIVGAGSIVTKNLESNAIYAGIPARFVKNIDDYKQNVLSKAFMIKGLSDIEKRKFLSEKYL